MAYPQASSAQGFTGEEFATWSQVSQDSYIQASVMMAGVVAQIQPELSRCVDQWYFVDAARKAQRNDTIRAFIIENAGYHPSGVILAVVQQECGAFE